MMRPLFRRLRGKLGRHGKTWLWSVTVALVVLGLILGGVYQVFQGIALRSVARLEAEFSAQTDALSNLMDTTVRNYGMQIFHAPSAVQLREDARLTNNRRVQNLRELSTFVGSSEFVDSIHVYNPATGLIHTTTSNLVSAPADEFADRSAAELLLAPDPDTRMKPIRRTAFAGQPGRERTYYSFLFFETGPDGRPRGGALLLDVASSWYVGTLLAFDDQQSCVLLDEAGELVAAPGEAARAWALELRGDVLADDDPDTGRGYLLRRLDGVLVVCSYSRMESSGWYYLRVQSLDRSVPGLLRLRDALFAFFAVLAALLAVALLTIFVPFRRIRRALRRAGTAPHPPERQITELVQSSLEYRQSQLLLAMLEGRALPDAQTPAPPLGLLLADTADPGGLRCLLLEDCPGALTSHQSGSLVALLPGVDAGETAALAGGLADRTGCRCYCGTPRRSPAELPGCYAALREMQRLRFRYPDRLLLREADLPSAPAHSSFSERQGALLLSTLRAGKLEEGRAVWAEIAGSVAADSYRDQVFAFKRVAKLLQEAMAELDLPDAPLLTDDFLAGLEDLADLTARLDHAFREIARRSADLRRRRLDGLAGQVSRLIDAQYADSSLSPARIADELGMSSAYLGRLFRESLGLSISESINAARIRHACELLLSTELPVEAVAEAVGFGNPKYFFVVFKKQTGQTPLQYRKAHATG